MIPSEQIAEACRKAAAIAPRGLREDAYGEALVCLLRRAEGRVWANAAHRMAWATLTAKGRVKDWLERERRVGADELEEPERVRDLADTPAAVVESAMDAGERRSLLNRALARLPAEDRRLFLRHYVRGELQDTFAKELGVTPGAICLRLRAIWRRVEAAARREPAAGDVVKALPQLTRREREVLHWMAQGKTNPEIGIILGIARATAQTHVHFVLTKLGVENRYQAAAMYQEFEHDYLKEAS